MKEELDFIFGNVSEINLTEEVKEPIRGEEPMFTGNTIAIVKNAMTIFGLGSMLYSGISIVAPDRLGENALKGMEPTEQAYLQRVQRYCFNAVPMLNDRETCQVWANNYVKLVSGVDRPLELFGADVKTRLATELNPSRKSWESEAEAAIVPGKYQEEGPGK